MFKLIGIERSQEDAGCVQGHLTPSSPLRQASGGGRGDAQTLLFIIRLAVPGAERELGGLASAVPGDPPSLLSRLIPSYLSLETGSGRENLPSHICRRIGAFTKAPHPSVIVHRAAPARRSSYLLPCTGYPPRLICRESQPCHRTALTGIQLPHSLTDHFE
ncbi:unnamed protein product [Gadus morhua 'NCC']